MTNNRPCYGCDYDRVFLYPQILNEGKTTRHPSVKFPEGWEVSHTANYWSNENKYNPIFTKIVTRHEKAWLMYTKYTGSYKTEYLHYCTSYLQSASCIRFCRNDCISG